MPLFNAPLRKYQENYRNSQCEMSNGAFSDVATTTVFHLSEIEKADAELFLVPASNK